MDDYSNVIDESLAGMARVSKIVSDLKDFAHVDKAELEHADLNKGIESTLNIVWNELKYKARVIKDFGKIPLVKCYPQRVKILAHRTRLWLSPEGICFVGISMAYGVME